jgi:hypothetical protein
MLATLKLSTNPVIISRRGTANILLSKHISRIAIDQLLFIGTDSRSCLETLVYQSEIFLVVV